MEINRRGRVLWRAMKAERTAIAWSSILGVLPDDLSKVLKTSGSVDRWRKIRDGQQLLWLCLMFANLLVG